MSVTKVFRRFRDVKIGEEFEFARPPLSGMATGPWKKTGQRRYMRLSDGMRCRVGSINAQVEPLPGWSDSQRELNQD